MYHYLKASLSGGWGLPSAIRDHLLIQIPMLIECGHHDLSLCALEP